MRKTYNVKNVLIVYQASIRNNVFTTSETETGFSVSLLDRFW